MAGVRALKGDRAGHRRVAIYHAVATWVSYIIVITLVRLGFELEGKAPEWIVSLHLAIIYAIPPLLALMLFTGLKSLKSVHKALAASYVAIWSGALITGFMIFLMARKLI